MPFAHDMFYRTHDMFFRTHGTWPHASQSVFIDDELTDSENPFLHNQRSSDVNMSKWQEYARKNKIDSGTVLALADVLATAVNLSDLAAREQNWHRGYAVTQDIWKRALRGLEPHFE